MPDNLLSTSEYRSLICVGSSNNPTITTVVHFNLLSYFSLHDILPKDWTAMEIFPWGWRDKEWLGHSLVHALVFSKLYYCSSVWSSTSACNVHKLQYVQNFAARIICNVRKYDHISSTLRNLRWLPVKTNLYYRDATLTFKCMAGQAPEYLTSEFVTRGSVSRRITRNSQQLNIPLCKSTTGQTTFGYRSVSIWNKLDSRLKQCEKPASFKRAFKRHLLSEFLFQ